MPLRLPKLFNLRSDPFETADHEGMDYERWRVEHVFLLVPAQQYVGQFLATFKEFPPQPEARQLPHRRGAGDAPAGWWGRLVFWNRTSRRDNQWSSSTID